MILTFEGVHSIVEAVELVHPPQATESHKEWEVLEDALEGHRISGILCVVFCHPFHSGVVDYVQEEGQKYKGNGKNCPKFWF